MSTRPVAGLLCLASAVLAQACSSGPESGEPRRPLAPLASTAIAPSTAAASAVVSHEDAPPRGPLATEYAEVAKKIVDRATSHHAAHDRLAFLTDRIGNRLAGSPGLDRAIAWAKGEMEKGGFESVHTEKVKVPHWERGRESAVLVAPEARALHILGLGGTVATPRKGITAEVVVVHSFDELDKLGEGGAKGKIVLFDVPMPPYSEEKGSGYGDVVKYRSAGPTKAAKLGAVAVLVRSLTARSLQLPHTGALHYEDDGPKIPAAAVTTEDAALLTRLAKSGAAPKVTLVLSGKDLPDAESANVIGELTGRESKDEIVILGAHIDSWDVGQGAHDDGAGCVMVMQALADLKALGLRPRRTLRVVLFTNEENGIRGARAFGEAHKDELTKIVAAYEADLGGFAPKGFNVEAPEAKRAAVLDRARDLASLLAPLGVRTIEAGFSGADLIPLTKAQVVGFGLVTDHRHYFDIHHTEADTLDKVDPDELAKSVAATAVLGYVLADAKDRIDR